MINFINGAIVAKTENSLIIECNDIGYEIFVSSNTLVNIGFIGEKVKVFTFMHVKEDDICLYGFMTMQEKEMFLKLTTVSGIGPKMAMQILSGLSLSDLAIAIKKEDIKLLSTIKGLGKKTAERLALELKDKVDIVGFTIEDNELPVVNQNMVEEATDALVALGINKNEAYRLASINAQGAETTEDIIRKTFQSLNG